MALQRSQRHRLPLARRLQGAPLHVGPAAAAVGLVVAFVAAGATIGADARWLAALGRAVADTGAIPHGVPYASAPSDDWPNVPVLAELIVHGLVASLGDRGLLLAQVAAVTGAFTFLALDMRRNGAAGASSALVLILIAFGSASSLFLIRGQLFSLVLFPAVAFLLRLETRAPSRRIWLVPLVLALWSNLHGAVLVGLAITGTYLVFDRARRATLEAAAILASSVVAVCATPALERTPAYYIGVMRNAAAQRGEGLWAPLSLSSKLDLALAVTGVILIALALRARPALWEAVALAALAVLTIKTARSGVWLLFFAGPLSARSFRFRAGASRRWPAVATAACLIVTVYEVASGPRSSDVSGRLIQETLRQARGTPVLADGRSAEQLALAGGRVWMSNPLDAFPLRDQRLYLDWLDGRAGGEAALAHAPRAVLVRAYGAPEQLTVRSGEFRVAARDAYGVLYVRR
ncbi:MAG: hypothetical protein ACJ74R_03975 [Gaiellaceae bacterium]